MAISATHTLEHYALDIFFVLVGAILIAMAIFLLVSKSTIFKGAH
jgi:hypothetical protein